MWFGFVVTALPVPRCPSGGLLSCPVLHQRQRCNPPPLARPSIQISISLSLGSWEACKRDGEGWKWVADLAPLAPAAFLVSRWECGALPCLAATLHFCGLCDVRGRRGQADKAEPDFGGDWNRGGTGTGLGQSQDGVCYGRWWNFFFFAWVGCGFGYHEFATDRRSFSTLQGGLCCLAPIFGHRILLWNRRVPLPPFCSAAPHSSTSLLTHSPQGRPRPKL